MRNSLVVRWAGRGSFTPRVVTGDFTIFRGGSA